MENMFHALSVFGLYVCTPDIPNYMYHTASGNLPGNLAFRFTFPGILHNFYAYVLFSFLVFLLLLAFLHIIILIGKLIINICMYNKSEKPRHRPFGQSASVGQVGKAETHNGKASINFNLCTN
jgi:hypothetical protein